MSDIKQIQVDSTTYDIKAVALDSALDATLIHKSNLVDGFTQSAAGVNALDAHAGKTLNDGLSSVAGAISTNSTLTTTIDTMLANGVYAMNGASAVGTFPANSGKYGVLSSIKRGTSTFQTLMTAQNIWTRSVDNNVGAWHGHDGEILTGTINGSSTSGGKTTVSVNFDMSSAHLLVAGHGSYANSRGVYIITSGSVYAVVDASNLTIGMAGGTLTITNSSSSGAGQYWII